MTGYGLDDRGIGVTFQAEARDFSLLHNAKTGAKYHPAPYTMYGGEGVKLTTHLHLVLRLLIRGSLPLLPHTSSWRRAELIRCRSNLTFTLVCLVKMSVVI
jgi:hypothetical protein